MGGMIALDSRFLIGAVAGFALTFAIAFLALQFPAIGFVAGVWLYLAIHSRGSSMDARRAALFPILYTALFYVAFIFGVIGLATSGLLGPKFFDSLFPITTYSCILLDLVLTFALAAIAGIVFWSVKKALKSA